MNNILIIEDESSVSEILKAYLEKEGYKVFCSQNGLDGIELFRKNNIKLVILDLMLPDIEGEEVCRILRKISDESDNFLISFATTPNPLPASPALAASIDALSESKLVFFDISPNISNIKIIFLISFHKILLKIM